ncbi:hypothetical protein J2741_000881 [Methanolinea mesophila]|nr:hypothetical protein [Methanolinea mesophila]
MEKALGAGISFLSKEVLHFICSGLFDENKKTLPEPSLLRV